jgi:hypothetical protein
MLIFPRRPGGFDQPVDDPQAAGGIAGQQMLGDTRVSAVLLSEQLRGTAVT